MTTLRTDISDGDPDHAGIHNATNAEVNAQGSAINTNGLNLTAVINGSGRALPTGETVLPRWTANGNTVGTASGSLKLSYFTALRTETITTVRLYVGAVVAGATPTLTRIGIWSATDDGALTGLVASTANDTALLTGSTNSSRTKALQSSWSKGRGNRYAIGVLVVTGATAPQFLGTFPGVSAETGDGQRWAGNVSGLTDLPTTQSAGSIGNATSVVQFHLLQ